MGNLCTVDVFDVYGTIANGQCEVEDADTHTKQGPRYGDLRTRLCQSLFLLLLLFFCLMSVRLSVGTKLKAFNFSTSFSRPAHHRLIHSA